MNASSPTATFLLEAEDLLTQIEDIVLDLGKQADDGEAIGRLFRAFHTIKGSGAMFGFESVASFTHHIENALDKVRNGEARVTAQLIQLILASRDQITELLEQPQSSALTPGAERIIAEVRDFLGESHQSAKPVTVAVAQAPAAAAVSQGITWLVSFVPPQGIVVSGLEPTLLLRDLRSLGACEVLTHLQAVPSLQELEVERCYLSWEIRLTTDRGLDAIKDVFIFVEDESKLSITALAALAVGSTTSAVAAVAAPGKVESLPTPGRVAPAAESELSVAAGVSKRSSAKDSSVRVPADKLDRLVNLVGELVMNQSRLAQVAARLGDADLAGPAEAIERLVGELRDSVLGIRMMPIGTTFSRFKRLVHDLSKDLGKEVELVTEGADTELDKTVLDQLGDPLVHLIRNSLDHGIESPERRTASGKPAKGTLRLTASHEGSHVVVSIHDDGKGLDTDAIRTKAIEKGLISPDQVLSERETFALIFLPGFSTAKQVTAVSGRGVGMDVVKRQIDALRGGIQIESTRGVGTTIHLTLPLTLAIIDGLLVELDGDQFIIPMSVVTENVELQRSERSRHNGRNTIAVRGELIPYLRLRELFEIGGEEPEIEKIVIARHDGQRIGLVVDRVLGSHQTVIQSLGRFYKHIEVCSGATIMGNGRVALIFDLSGLISHVKRTAPPARAA